MLFRSLGIAAATAAVLAAVAFVPPWLLLSPVAAGVVGVLAYGALVAVVRPPGLRASWRYLHALS